MSACLSVKDLCFNEALAVTHIIVISRWEGYLPPLAQQQHVRSSNRLDLIGDAGNRQTNKADL